MASNNITLSLIVPCYNVVRYLPTILPCLDRQWTHREDYEIIFVNDGSTDDTLAQLQEYVATHPHARIIDKPKNEGLAEARNTAIVEARGTWLTFVDADDMLADGTIEALMDIADRTSAQSIKFGFHNLNENEFTPEYLKMPDALTIEEKQVADYVPAYTGCTIVFRRDCILEKDLRYPNITPGEDTYFDLLCYSAFRDYVLVKDKLYIVIMRPGSLSDMTNSAKCKRIVDNMVHCLELVNQAEQEGRADPELCLYINVYSLKYIMYGLTHAHCTVPELQAFSHRLIACRALRPKYRTLLEPMRLYLFARPRLLHLSLPLLRLLHIN